MVATDLRDPYDIAVSLRDWSRHWERQIVPSGCLVVLACQVSNVQGGGDADKGGKKQGIENNGTHLISPIRCFVLTLMYAHPYIQTNDIYLILYIVYLNLNYEHLALPNTGRGP